MIGFFWILIVTSQGTENYYFNKYTWYKNIPCTYDTLKTRSVNIFIILGPVNKFQTIFYFCLDEIDGIVAVEAIASLSLI